MHVENANASIITYSARKSCHLLKQTRVGLSTEGLYYVPFTPDYMMI
jgi:hypothetical protein